MSEFFFLNFKCVTPGKVFFYWKNNSLKISARLINIEPRHSPATLEFRILILKLLWKLEVFLVFVLVVQDSSIVTFTCWALELAESSNLVDFNEDFDFDSEWSGLISWEFDSSSNGAVASGSSLLRILYVCPPPPPRLLHANLNLSFIIYIGTIIINITC